MGCGNTGSLYSPTLLWSNKWPDLLKRLHTATLPAGISLMYQEHFLVTQGHRSFSSAGQLLHLPVLLSPCTGPCLAPLSPPDSTGKKTPQPGELLPLLCRTAASLWAPLGSLTLQQVSAVKAFCPASSLKALKQTKEVTAPQTEIHSGVKKLWKHSSHLAETRQVVTHLQDENVSTKF